MHTLTAVVGMVLCSQAIGVAGTLTIDFEGFADSTILTNQYPGLTFSNTIIYTAGITLNEFEFPPHSGSNVASDNGGPITIWFDSPITAFSGYFTYAEPIAITAYDASNNELSSVSSQFSNNEAISGDLGSSPNEFLQLDTAVPASTVTIAGDPNGGSFVMDDMTYTTSTPEPSSLTIICLPLVALAAIFLFKRTEA